MKTSTPHARGRAAQHHILAVTLCLMLTACAGAGGFGGSRKINALSDPTMTLQRATELAVPGRATKADIAAALGPAGVVRFDSGYEIWVYRERPAQPNADSAELVILFTPAGVVQKARVRPAYQSQRS
ncbi:MAG: hypothetical protein H7332_04400 [Bdellovibrionales bacterium]|nr:hypothetical protein [Ramlibacter sp.]